MSDSWIQLSKEQAHRTKTAILCYLLVSLRIRVAVLSDAIFRLLNRRQFRQLVELNVNIFVIFRIVQEFGYIILVFDQIELSVEINQWIFVQGASDVLGFVFVRDWIKIERLGEIF